MIYIFRVTTGQEKIVAQMLEKKAKAQDIPIHAILISENVRGYLFVESKDENAAVKLATNTKHVKGLLKKAIGIEEIEKMIKTEKPASATVELGDLVEIRSGPFKGEKAKVTKMDPIKEDLTVELIEVAVPIPVTIKQKIVKLFRKAGEEV
ncbi:transcription elongation factor Spt5 [Candidatus Micrarchaeota archaeon]|nr:transcription elongation factor Spt5 [Candidatus Micrarchaeota archaeon]